MSGLQILSIVAVFGYINSVPIFEPRVINGDDSSLGQFPWHVGIAGVYFDIEVFLCNGVIINEEWVLTTAYCIHGAPPQLTVHAGSINVNRDDGVTTNASTLILHEEFDNLTLRNDIALIQLNPPLSFDGNISAVDLDTQELEAGVVATITGWGFTNENGDNQSLILQYAEVTTIDNIDCQIVYGVDAVPPSVVCTSGGDSGKTPCLGDAGGPLVINADSSPLLVAIFSFISGLGCQEYPAGYSRIAYYRDWINGKSGV